MYERGSCSKSSLYMNNDFTNIEIQVLLVHRNEEISTLTCKQLESLRVKVTTYQCAQSALSLVADGSKEFDLMLVDADLAEPTDPFTTLGFATAMNLPTILISSKNYDENLARRALMNGALNLLTVPMSEETVRYCLWYPMMQKKLKDKNNINQRSTNSGSTERARENISPEKTNGPEMLRNRRKYTKKRGQELKWTDELRQKFWNAVNQLDDGSCVPKKIVEMMGVPGLTRLQVSSYLQKCRYEIKQRTLAATQPESSGDSVTKRKSANGAKPIIPNVGISISSNNRSRYTRLIYPQQPSAETPHFGANRLPTNAGERAAYDVDTEAIISMSEAPESSSAGEKRPPFYNFLPSEGEENVP